MSTTMCRSRASSSRTVTRAGSSPSRPSSACAGRCSRWSPTVTPRRPPMAESLSHPAPAVPAATRLAAAAPATPAPPVRASRFKTPGEGNSGTISVVTVVVLLALWTLVTNMGWVKPLFLPTPQAVFEQFWAYLTGQANDKPLWQHFLASMFRVFSAFLLACVTAIPVGIAMGMSRWARGIFDPPLEFYRPLPPLAYLPLIIIWFGIDELPKVLLIFLSCFAPLALAARSGMRSAAQEQINAAYSMGASYWQVVRHVVLPAAMPEILVGMRIAIGFGWTTLVAAEMGGANLR